MSKEKKAKEEKYSPIQQNATPIPTEELKALPLTENKEELDSQFLQPSEAWAAYQERLQLSEQELATMQLIYAVMANDEKQIHIILQEEKTNANTKAPARLGAFRQKAPIHFVTSATALLALRSINQNQFNVNIQDGHGNTLLAILCSAADSMENRNTIVTLLTLKADMHLTNRNGISPRVIAQLSGNNVMYDFLLKVEQTLESGRSLAVRYTVGGQIVDTILRPATKIPLPTLAYAFQASSSSSSSSTTSSSTTSTTTSQDTTPEDPPTYRRG